LFWQCIFNGKPWGISAEDWEIGIGQILGYDGANIVLVMVAFTMGVHHWCKLLNVQSHIVKVNPCKPMQKMSRDKVYCSV